MLVIIGYILVWFGVSVISALIIQYNETDTMEGTINRATQIFIFPYKVAANLVKEIKSKL